MFIAEMFNKNDRRVIVTYPGRFQPFHLGHKDVFESIQAKFGLENSFILTSNKSDYEKSPFTFRDKLVFLHASGIPDHSIIQTNKMYDLPSQFKGDEKNIIFVTVIGEKDSTRLNVGGTDKNGNPSYYQKMPSNLKDAASSDVHCYVMYAKPRTSQIQIGDESIDVSSATNVRALWNTVRDKKDLRSQFLSQMFGRDDPELGRLMDKIPQQIEECAGVVRDGNDYRYVYSTMGDDNDVNGDTLNKMMRGYHLVGGQTNGGGMKKVNPNIGKGMKRIKESRINPDFDPFNYDSVEDYRADTMPPSDESLYYDRVARNERNAALTEPKKEYSKTEGKTDSGRRYNMTITFRSPDQLRNEESARRWIDVNYGAKMVVDSSETKDSLTLYVIDNHKHGYQKAWVNEGVKKDTVYDPFTKQYVPVKRPKVVVGDYPKKTKDDAKTQKKVSESLNKVVTIVTRQNRDGSFDEVGMNNRAMVSHLKSERAIRKYATDFGRGLVVRIEYYSNRHSAEPFKVEYVNSYGDVGYTAATVMESSDKSKSKSAREEFYDRHQKIRKEMGLPDPKEYEEKIKKYKDEAQKEKDDELKNIDESRINIGDIVRVSEDRFKNAKGIVDSFGHMGRFIVVEVFGHGKHSFSFSQVKLMETGSLKGMTKGISNFVKAKQKPKTKVKPKPVKENTSGAIATSMGDGNGFGQSIFYKNAKRKKKNNA